ncbi:MAG TPA: hypothetical protein VH539_20745 [Gemmatimonadaceae bacterium]
MQSASHPRRVGEHLAKRHSQHGRCWTEHTKLAFADDQAVDATYTTKALPEVTFDGRTSSHKAPIESASKQGIFRICRKHAIDINATYGSDE